MPTANPTPIPWVDQSGEGIGSWDVPFLVYAGTTIAIRLWNLPAPASCTLAGTFPDGTPFDLGRTTAIWTGPTAGTANAYSAIWELTIPIDQVGSADWRTVCTYLDIERLDTTFGATLRPPE